jgi:peptidoglycan hydrolase CwlO-like protein
MKKIIFGFILGAGLMFAMQAGAATLIGSKVSGTMNFKFNGKIIGAAPVINGTTYLPAKTVATALDLTMKVAGGSINLADQELQKMKDEGEALNTAFNNLNRPRSDLKQEIDRLTIEIQSLKNSIAAEEIILNGTDDVSNKNVSHIKIRGWNGVLTEDQSRLEEIQPQFAEADRLLNEFLVLHPEFTKFVNK